MEKRISRFCMKKLSPRAFTAVTNSLLILIVACVAIVCFYPTASPATALSDRAYYHGNSEDGVSLTFNVYWGTDEVYKIMDVLDEYGAKATFFLGGSWADDNVACVREIASRGHELGSHGYFHKEHDKLDFEENFREIQTSVEFIKAACGVTIELFAPPSGAYSEDTVNAAEALGLKTILWSKDTIDWRDKDAALCMKRATQNVKGGDIILMHPMAHTVEALPQILKSYAKKGLRAIPVGENISAQ